MAGIETYYGRVETPKIGTFWVAVGPKGLIAVDWGGSEAKFVACLKKQGFTPKENARKLSPILGQLKKYANGDAAALKTKIDWSMVDGFTRKALQEAAKIPPGQTRSYGEIAQRVGRPGGARAVGNAMRKNPYAPWVPCHRVIKSDGSLGGYSGSYGSPVKMKKYLLDLEKREAGVCSL